VEGQSWVKPFPHFFVRDLSAAAGGFLPLKNIYDFYDCPEGRLISFLRKLLDGVF